MLLNDIFVLILIFGRGCIIVGKIKVAGCGGDIGFMKRGFDMSDKKYKQFLFPGGIVVLILGVWMILAWWGDVVLFFKGFLGIAVAVGGLLMMYTKKV